jgi:microcystin-dependent protein
LKAFSQAEANLEPLPTKTMSDPFIAEIRIVGFNFAPRGWAFCQGQTMNIAQNTALFSLLGTTYGGNGTTTYGIPNLQDRMPMHPGNGPGLTPRSLGQQAGSSQVTLTTPQMPAHSHTVMANTAAANQTNPAGNVLARGRNTFSTALSNPAALAPTSVSVQGNGLPHNNQSPYLSMNFIIALQGIFPPRP